MGVLVGDAHCWILGSLQGRRREKLNEWGDVGELDNRKKKWKNWMVFLRGRNVVIEKSEGWSHWGWRGSTSSLQALC